VKLALHYIFFFVRTICFEPLIYCENSSKLKTLHILWYSKLPRPHERIFWAWLRT